MSRQPKNAQARTRKLGPNQWHTWIGEPQNTPLYEGHPCHDCGKPTTGGTHCAACARRNSDPRTVTTFFGAIVLRNLARGIDRTADSGAIAAAMNRWIDHPDALYQVIHVHTVRLHGPCEHARDLFDLLEEVPA